MSNKVTVKDICDAVDTTALVARPLSDWRPVLAKECGVYVHGETYLAKRFDAINYKFCDKETAKEILVDNLYALLRFKYFPKTSETIDERIAAIVKSFTANLKTTLHKVSFDESSSSNRVQYVPDYCVAFRNGVYNFKDDKWLFKYDIIRIEQLSNHIYLYDSQYIISWYLDYDFEPLPISISSTSLADFIKLMKSLTKDPQSRNYCFELLYNMAHDEADEFSMNRFEHLTQVLGYTMLQSFSQYFVFLIGAGQNGKNSLFDGCFTNRLVPRPASNSLDAIEQDRFITGALENRSHNIFLETSPKTYTMSTMIKALTGSMYQTIESKGVSKYSGVINCKFIFSGNDQEKIKFSDNTRGFRRRINMLEIFYTWDQQKRFLKRGDYYDTSFSDSLSEITRDPLNTTAYVYFAMYGIMSGTDNFSANFRMTYNDWSIKFADIDFELKDRLERITLQRLSIFLNEPGKSEYIRTAMFDDNKRTLAKSETLREVGLTSDVDGLYTMLRESEYASAYFAEHDIYITTSLLKDFLKNFDTTTAFNQRLKQLYSLTGFTTVSGNKNAVKCTFQNGRLRILK